MTAHLIGLDCGHFRPADGFTDADALMFLGTMLATSDSAFCGPCGGQRTVTGPAVRVVEQAPPPTRGSFAAVLDELAAEHLEAQHRHGFTDAHDNGHDDGDWAWMILRRVSELLAPPTVLVQSDGDRRRHLVEVAHIAASGIAAHDRRAIGAGRLDRAIATARAAHPDRTPVEAFIHTFDLDGVTTSANTEWRFVARASDPAAVERHVLECADWRMDPPCTGACVTTGVPLPEELRP